jgi:hypothetical protein
MSNANPPQDKGNETGSFARYCFESSGFFFGHWSLGFDLTLVRLRRIDICHCLVAAKACFRILGCLYLRFF